MGKRFVILFTLFFSLTWPVVATGSKEQPRPVQITIMHGWGGAAEDHKAMRAIFDDFQRRNPDIDVIFTAYPDLSIVLSKLNDAQAVGNVPDVVSVNGHAVSFYNAKKRGLALDLSPYLLADPDFSSDVSDRVISSLREKDGSLYTIPEVIEVVGYWYNKDILDAAGILHPPTTWNELIDDIKRVSATTDKEGVALDNWQLAWVFAASLASQSDEALAFMQRERDTVPLQDVQRAIDIVITLSRLGRYDLSSASSRDFFYEWNTAFYFNGVWANPQLSSTENQRKLLPAAYPGYQGKSASFVSATPGFIISSRGSDKQKEAAVRFVKYMVSEEVQRRIFSETGQVPENSKITTNEMANTSPVLGSAVKLGLEAEYQLFSYALTFSSDQLIALENFCKAPDDIDVQKRLLASF